MIPFECANDAMAWIAANAVGPVECFVWNERYIIGGSNETGEWRYN